MERIVLTAVLALPLVGWLGYFFLEPPPDSGPTLDEKAVAAEPGRLSLLWLLRRELDDELLGEMAASDGGMGAEEYYRALVDIFQTGEVSLESAPFELCNMLGYGDAVVGEPLSPEKRRRQVRTLFACWILVNAYVRPERRDNGLVENGDEWVRLGTWVLKQLRDRNAGRLRPRLTEFEGRLGASLRQ